MFILLKKVKTEWNNSVIKAKRVQEIAEPIDDENWRKINQCTNLKDMYEIADKEITVILDSEVSAQEKQTDKDNKKTFLPFNLAVITILIIFIIYLLVN